MRNYQTIIPLFILFAFLAYRWFSQRGGRPGIRHITASGVAFCVASLNLWFITRFEEVLASLPSPHSQSVFATPWLWVSALSVGVTLLLISFFTRKRQRLGV
jgi:hypothetical protein